MSDYSVNGQVHHAKRVNKVEFFIYFALIFSTRPFRLGDVIELIDTGDKPGIKGRVVDIQLVYTTLEDVMPENAGALLQVPNALFFQKSLRRWRNDPGTLSL